eukprot:778900-Prymnesium_polylepis.1
MIGTLKRALDSACDLTSKILDVDESTARVIFAGSLTTLAVTAVGLGSHEVARRLRNSSTDEGTDAPSCSKASQLERTEDDWKPKPNVQLPNGKWVWHPDFDVEMDSISETTSSTRKRTWSHAHVLPNGLLKDTREEESLSSCEPRVGPSNFGKLCERWCTCCARPSGDRSGSRAVCGSCTAGAKARYSEDDDSDFTDDEGGGGGVKYRSTAGLSLTESNAGYGLNDRRRGPPQIRRLPCIRPGGSP